MRCKVCQTEVPSANINLQRMVAKCPSCKVEFDFINTDYLNEPPIPPGTQVPKPQSIELYDRLGRSELSFRWLSGAHIVLALFAVVIDGSCLFWYHFFLRNPDITWLMFFFPILHGAAGMLVTYLMLGGLLNRTWIMLEDDILLIRHRPLPWTGNRDLEVAKIAQLHCEMQLSKDAEGNISHSYHLNAVLKDGTRIPLLSNGRDREELRFIEQQLNKWLNMQERPGLGAAPK